MPRTDDLLWQRWDEVDRLLDGALDLPADQRTAHVASRAAEDPALRDLVLRLLDQLEAQGDRVTGPPDAVVLGAFSGGEPLPADDLAPGTAVGRYVIRGRRGRGGMATVYEAERSDGSYQQRVALKVLRRGLDTEDLIRRFLTERQILSSLTHPNIARLLDGGSLPDGRPFLVMELVEGQPITSYADTAGLDLRARLDLFLDVAGAVSAAHRQLVVHRDIKPSNILVDAQGHVKLLDFGIAKLLAGDEVLTEADARALTPDYASPEQVRGGTITTGTDVYQLGLLVRELLTGLKPLAGDTRPGEPPIRPSRGAALTLPGSPSPEERAEARGTTPPTLARTLRGDLDIIVAKALRPEPEERYRSADELAGDVRRYLRGQPIAAHPESARYRARKFLGRHPAVLPALVAIILVIAAYVATLLRHNQRLERERDLAEAASRRAIETQAFFVGLLRSADPYSPADPERGRSITVMEALRMGADRVRIELENQPEVRTTLLSTIGEVMLNLDQLAEARAMVDEALSARTARGDTVSTAFSDDLNLLGRLLHAAGRHDSARMVLHQVVQLERSRVPGVPERLSRTLQTLAITEGVFDQETKLRLGEEAVSILQNRQTGTLAGALRFLADAYREANRGQESERAAREALTLYERLEGPSSANTGLAVHTLGQTVGTLGRLEEAAELIQRSLRIFDERLGPAHGYSVAMRNNLAVLLITSEAYREAEPVMRAVLEARREQQGAGHPLVAGAYQNLAVAVSGQGRHQEAEEYTRIAEQIYRKAMPAGSPVLALPMLTRAEIQLRSGDAAGAARSSAEAAGILRGKVPTNSPPAIMADCRLGRARSLLGDLAGARVLLDSAVRRMASAGGMRESHRAECANALAELPEVPRSDR